jgi:hypothetical protein
MGYVNNLVCLDYHSYFYSHMAIAQSPSCVRQEFEDKRNDWAEGQGAAKKMAILAMVEVC